MQSHPFSDHAAGAAAGDWFLIAPWVSNQPCTLAPGLVQIVLQDMCARGCSTSLPAPGTAYRARPRVKPAQAAVELDRPHQTDTIHHVRHVEPVWCTGSTQHCGHCLQHRTSVCSTCCMQRLHQPSPMCWLQGQSRSSQAGVSA